MSNEDAYSNLNELHSWSDSESSCLINQSKWKRFSTWIITFCQTYGSVIAYYGASYGAFFSALSVPLLNEYYITEQMICRFEGGCKYPYLSEVARKGVGWWTFFLGALIGCFPWMVFSVNYYQTFKAVGCLIKKDSRRKCFMFFQVVMLLFNILSSLGMLFTSFFDMGNFPMTHEYVEALFCIHDVECYSVRCSTESRLYYQFGWCVSIWMEDRNFVLYIKVPHLCWFLWWYSSLHFAWKDWLLQMYASHYDLTCSRCNYIRRVSPTYVWSDVLLLCRSLPRWLYGMTALFIFRDYPQKLSSLQKDALLAWFYWVRCIALVCSVFAISVSWS